jgi:NADPH:quinone reductase-like Zn-dependent oxidoreductase
MQALVVEPASPSAVRLVTVDPPTRSVSGDGVLVDVRHAALNFGDLNDARSGRVPPGGVLGSDLAGVVLESGPADRHPARVS